MKLKQPQKALLRGVHAVCLLAHFAMWPAIGYGASGESVKLRLAEQGAHDATVKSLADGSYEITTTGTDPYVFTEELPSNWSAQSEHVLAFEYVSESGCGALQVFLDPPLNEQTSITGAGLAASGTWSNHALDLESLLGRVKTTPRRLRLDFGSESGKTIHVRQLQLRPPNEAERQLALRRAKLREANRLRDARIRNYLHRTWACRVTEVAVGHEHIRIQGSVGGERDNLYLAEVPLFAEPLESSQFSSVVPVKVNAGGRFSVTVERRDNVGGKSRDRLLSRWAVVRRQDDSWEWLSSARYADSVAAEWNLPEEKPRSKKGLGGFSARGPVSDLDDLGISSVTVNIVLNGFMRASAGPGRTPFEYNGRTWYTDDNDVAQLDRTLREAARRHIIVSAIILIAPVQHAPDAAYARELAYPDADARGIFVMPNLVTREGVLAYAAALDFLARRYSRPDERFGRIHYWILHNEVDSGWIWTNAGEQWAPGYMDLYHKSLRAAELIARQYNSHAKVFISLDHFWALQTNKHCYPGRELLNLLLEFSHVEGDFDWGIAYHPYPQNLFNPRVWKDTQVTTNFDTPLITFKNLEVLVDWAKQPPARYQGKSVRAIHLTEQGFNSPDYREKSLQEQAAGMAYAWHKIERTPAIEEFDYHNWIDNRGEGGLRIGLRKFPDDPKDPLGRKPIWFLYQALGTPKEREAMSFALPITGVKEWSEVR